MTYIEPIYFTLYSIAGGVGKTTLSVALTYHFVKYCERVGCAVLLWSADYEKDDTVTRYFGGSAPSGSYDWALLERPHRYSRTLYLYSSPYARKLYETGKVEEALKRLLMAIAKLPSYLKDMRAPVAIVVLDLPKYIKPVIEVNGSRIEVLDLLREMTNTVFVATMEESSSFGTDAYKYALQYAGSIVVNKATDFKHLTVSGYKTIIRYDRRLASSPDARVTYSVLRKAGVSVDHSRKKTDIFTAFSRLVL